MANPFANIFQQQQESLHKRLSERQMREMCEFHNPNDNSLAIVKIHFPKENVWMLDHKKRIDALKITLNDRINDINHPNYHKAQCLSMM